MRNKSQSQSSGSESDQISKQNSENPNTIQKKKLRINTSRARKQLPVLKLVMKENEWVEVSKEGDILWSALPLPMSEVDIANEIIVNHIPALDLICDKRKMGLILNKFRQYWPQEFWFYPKTYLLPDNQEEFLEDIKREENSQKQEPEDSEDSQNSEQKQEKEKVAKAYIAKPSAGCGGDSIFLINKLSQIPKYGNIDWIVQPYIENPLLLDNKKFDFRMYVIICSVDPYICYVNDEGLARFCSEQYQKPTNENRKNSFMHLTNYSINKNHKNFVNGDNAFSRCSKRCLKTVWEDLSKKGIDVKKIKQKIDEVIQKFLIGIYPFIKYYYNGSFPKKNGKVFQVLGIDILVDENLQPWLLEANTSPSYSIDHEVQSNQKKVIKKEVSPVDEYVKSKVVGDAIHLATQTLQQHQQLSIGDSFKSYKKILDAQSSSLTEFNVIENMLKLFHSQCSIRSKWILNSSQFTNLSKLDGMTNEKVTKTDYHLIFIKIMRSKVNVGQMTFEDFIQAIEYIVKEIVGYNEENIVEVLQEHVENLVSQLK